MTHLGERITDFVFEELSAGEMAEGRRHVAECAECRRQVEQFGRTLAMLKALPDVDPPRRIVFEVEKPKFASLFWRWVAPTATAAAVAMAITTFAPPRQPIERVIVQQQPAAQTIDYERIINELKASQQAWLVNEFKKRDAEQSRGIQQLRGEVSYTETLQRAMWKETIENASSIQLLAQKRE